MKRSMTKDNDAQARARSQRPGSIVIWRIISTPYLEILVCLEYKVARTVARRAGASLLTASPTVPACRPAYAADLRAIGRLAMGRTVTALILCNIAHTRHLSTGLYGIGPLS